MGIRVMDVMADRDVVLRDIQSYVQEQLFAELSKVGDASLFNLATAIVAIEKPGIAGELVVSIPRKIHDRLEFHWRSAAPIA